MDKYLEIDILYKYFVYFLQFGNVIVSLLLIYSLLQFKDLMLPTVGVC